MPKSCYKPLCEKASLFKVESRWVIQRYFLLGRSRSARPVMRTINVMIMLGTTMCKYNLISGDVAHPMNTKAAEDNG